jgi:hypothetical protein
MQPEKESSAPDAKPDVKAEVGFVTKKVLVTFRMPIALMINDTAVFTQAAICELNEAATNERYDFTNRQLTVVGFADGRKLTKSLRLDVSFDSVTAVLEL